MNEDEIKASVDDQLNGIAELIELALEGGHNWLHSLRVDDWRSRRYKLTAPRRIRGAQAIDAKDGKPPVAYLASHEKALIKNTVLKGEAAAANKCNIIIRPDPLANKDGQGWISVLRVVPHDNFEQARNINFNIWFHGIANANLNKDQLFGWRFEGSEGKITSHNLYHAQPIRGFVRGESYEGGVDWMPETFPTIPVAAKTPVELAFAVLLTLGGKESLRQIIRSARNTKLRIWARNYWSDIFGGESLNVNN